MLSRSAIKPFDVAAFDRGRVLKAARFICPSLRSRSRPQAARAAPARATIFFRRRLLVAGPSEPRRAVHSARWDDQPGQLHRSPPLLDAIEPASSGARRGLEADREERYAEHAAKHLRAWFLDDKTRMNPHLKFAQAIKGRVTGRGIGIIDTIHLVEVARAIDALEASAALSKAERTGIKQWFADYLDWMTTTLTASMSVRRRTITARAG